MGDGHEQQHEEQCHVMGREGRGGGPYLFIDCCSLDRTLEIYQEVHGAAKTTKIEGNTIVFVSGI